MDLLEQLQTQLVKPQLLIGAIITVLLTFGIWKLGDNLLALMKKHLSEREAEADSGHAPRTQKVMQVVGTVWGVIMFYVGAILLIRSLGLTALSPFYDQGNEVLSWLGMSVGRILAVGVLTYIALMFVGTLSRRIVAPDNFNRRSVRVNTLTRVVQSTLRIVILTIAAVSVLQNLGIQATTLLAGVSVLGLAVSFGAQSLVKDVFTGFFILLEDQYGVGDVITVNNNPNLSGAVEKLNLRVTYLRALDGTVHVIPNGQILTVSVASKDWSRTVAAVQVAYEADIERAIAVLTQVSEELYGDPKWRPVFLEEPSVEGVSALKSDGVEIRALFKVMPKEQWALGREFNRRIKTALEAQGIEIPFPQRTIHWSQTPLTIQLQRAPRQEAADKGAGSGVDLNKPGPDRPADG